MPVNPTGSGRVPGADPNRTRGAKSTQRIESPGLERAPDTEPPRVEDQISISEVARKLAELQTGTALTRYLEPDREREILDRIMDGYYERDDVQQQVLTRLAEDLGIEP